MGKTKVKEVYTVCLKGVEIDFDSYEGFLEYLITLPDYVSFSVRRKKIW